MPDVTASVPDVTRVKMLIKKDACNREKHAEEKQTMYLHHHNAIAAKITSDTAIRIDMVMGEATISVLSLTGQCKCVLSCVFAKND